MKNTVPTELTITLRYDPHEPTGLGACPLVETVGGLPCVVVSNLLTVDETRLGHLLAMLLTDVAADDPGHS